MSYLTFESMRVRDLPHEDRPACQLHAWFLVELTTYRITHRCRDCLRYATQDLKNVVDERGQASLF